MHAPDYLAVNRGVPTQLQGNHAAGDTFIGAIVAKGESKVSFFEITGGGSTPLQLQEEQSSEQGPCAWLEQHFTFVRCHASVNAVVIPFDHCNVLPTNGRGFICCYILKSPPTHCCRCTASGSLQRGAALQCCRWQLRVNQPLMRLLTA